jgi:hypothetical protein
LMWGYNILRRGVWLKLARGLWEVCILHTRVRISGLETK